jgi:hypothetical protein
MTKAEYKCSFVFLRGRGCFNNQHSQEKKGREWRGPRLLIGKWVRVVLFSEKIGS